MADAVVTTKRCRDCGQVKPLRSFQRSTAGRKPSCNACVYRRYPSQHDPEKRARYRDRAPRTTTCAICGGEGKTVWDHDHKTGAFRGYLCDLCNRALGMMGDDPDRLRAAADYLER